MTQPDPEDPLGDRYGDPPMVQSTERTGRTWTRVEDLSPELEGKTVRPGGGGWKLASRPHGAPRGAPRGGGGGAACGRARPGGAAAGAPRAGYGRALQGRAARPGRGPASPLWQVLVRARIHTTRGKGKSAFLVLRQRTATVQVRRPALPCDPHRPAVPLPRFGTAAAACRGPADRRSCQACCPVGSRNLRPLPTRPAALPTQRRGRRLPSPGPCPAPLQPRPPPLPCPAPLQPRPPPTPALPPSNPAPLQPPRPCCLRTTPPCRAAWSSTRAASPRSRSWTWRAWSRCRRRPWSRAARRT